MLKLLIIFLLFKIIKHSSWLYYLKMYINHLFNVSHDASLSFLRKYSYDF